MHNLNEVELFMRESNYHREDDNNGITSSILLIYFNNFFPKNMKA